MGLRKGDQIKIKPGTSLWSWASPAGWTYERVLNRTLIVEVVKTIAAGRPKQNGPITTAGRPRLVCYFHQGRLFGVPVDSVELDR